MFLEKIHTIIKDIVTTKYNSNAKKSIMVLLSSFLLGVPGLLLLGINEYLWGLSFIMVAIGSSINDYFIINTTRYYLLDIFCIFMLIMVSVYVGVLKYNYLIIVELSLLFYLIKLVFYDIFSKCSQNEIEYNYNHTLWHIMLFIFSLLLVYGMIHNTNIINIILNNSISKHYIYIILYIVLLVTPLLFLRFSKSCNENIKKKLYNCIDV